MARNATIRDSCLCILPVLQFLRLHLRLEQSRPVGELLTQVIDALAAEVSGMIVIARHMPMYTESKY